MQDTGLVTSQGDAATGADVARSAGVDGTGVIVGAVSDSYDCLGGAETDVTNGDLVTPVFLQDLEC
ncbi:MAG: hypothetical protein GWO04_35040, partial [Actinobacteria bacterium]|nr:hypothetical protein [Actinomycetota bacterium]